MGCGSSSLKGEKITNVGTEAPQPTMKKVRTNFSDVDFSGESQTRRGTVAVAPDEIRRPTKISENINEPGLTGIGAATETAGTDPRPQEIPEVPYQPLPDDMGLASPTSEIPSQTLGATGTATAGKENGSEDAGRKKSSFKQFFTEGRRDKSMEISDEELKKQTGMTRAEFEEWKKDPKNGVAGHQSASASGVGSGMGYSGIGAGAM